MRIFEFGNGYYVVHAKDENLVGNEVLAIGDTPADSVAAALAPWGIMSFAEPLQAIGVVEQAGEIPVRMQAPSGRQGWTILMVGLLTLFLGLKARVFVFGFFRSSPRGQCLTFC